MNTPLSALEESRGLSQTSEFESISIFDAIGRIGSQDKPLYLPAIQRHFVWSRDQISKLFDSMMRAYPIGTFLFWEVDDDKRNDYAFYEFMRDYNEHEAHCRNPTAPPHLPRNVVGVLDGQQRLNSMYVALCGSYSAFIGGQGNHRSKLDSFPKRVFHLNVFFEPNEEDERLYHFGFPTEWDSKPEKATATKCWFPVNRVFHCETLKDIELEWGRFAAKLDEAIIPGPERLHQVISTLDLLRRRIREEKLLTFFPIRNRDLTEALQIFIRANNGGTSVSNAEMIFSTIIAHWQEGREKIENFTYNLNQVRNGFGFDVSSIMLACLALSGCSIRMRIESFKPAHVEAIRHKWESITATLREATEMLANWGLSGNNKTLKEQAATGLAILLARGIARDASKESLRMFVLKSLVCDIHRKEERSLPLIRAYAETHLKPGSVFDIDHFEAEFELPSGQRMEVTHEILEQLLMLDISDRRTYGILSLLHPHHAQHQEAFHKDHIHPNSRFSSMREFELGWEREQIWWDWKDKLPNLQLLQDGENLEKRATAFIDWLPLYRPNEDARMTYLSDNHIPANASLAFADFEEFFTRRKDMLREKLVSLLKIAPPIHSIASPTGAQLVESN
jgi:hypothetical protein